LLSEIGELMVEDLDGVMEIGPGMGVMTAKFIFEMGF